MSRDESRTWLHGRLVRARLLARALLLLAVALTLPARANAEAAPDRWRTAGYYGVSLGITGALLAGSLALSRLPAGPPGSDPAWFPGDLSLRGRDSSAAARLSEATLIMTVLEPVAAELGRGGGARLANAGVVYSQTLSASLLLNMAVKVSFRRPRPYTYRRSAEGDESDDDWYVSFYSGHSSMSFAAATSGAYLFAESAPSGTARALVWGGELALASTTAGLRLRAGKHYYSDVLVGMLVGAGLGIGIPILHGEKYRPRGAEYAAAGGGWLAGLGLSQVVPFPTDPPKRAGLVWSVGPIETGTGPGFGAHGYFF